MFLVHAITATHLHVIMCWVKGNDLAVSRAQQMQNPVRSGQFPSPLLNRSKYCSLSSCFRVRESCITLYHTSEKLRVPGHSPRRRETSLQSHFDPRKVVMDMFPFRRTVDRRVEEYMSLTIVDLPTSWGLEPHASRLVGGAPVVHQPPHVALGVFISWKKIRRSSRGR